MSTEELGPIDDTIRRDNVAGVLERVLLPDEARPTPMATCPRDGAPLIMTFERAGAEFHCLECGSWLGFMAPAPETPTEELNARYEDLKARFDAGERGGAQ